MKAEILRMLREAKDSISGQTICNELGVSRTAVWKYINQLKEDGYQIEAIQNKGYTILEYPDIITESEIKSVLCEGSLGNYIYAYDEIDSTNNEAKKKAEEGAKHGTLLIADTQKVGRGRRGRNWISPKGTGIWMSYILRPDIQPQSASMLTLVAALSVATAIEKTTNMACQIKWPNDIILNKKKVCGILTEMSTELDVINYLVVGIGINVNTTEFDEEIQEVASSIYLETKQKIKRSQLVADITNNFEKYYSVFMETEDMSILAKEYNDLLINVGKDVKISNVKHEFTGNAIGIDKQGELLVRTQDNTIVNVVAGEVSVRGLYGYV